MFEAIVFDFDGVLVDGIPWNDEVFMKTFENIGLKLDIDHLHTKIGMTVKQVITSIVEDSNLILDVDSMTDNHIENTCKIYDERAVMPDDLINFLDKCKRAGLKIGIASGSHSNILKLILNKFGIGDYFEAVVGGEMISKGKPDPGR